ncbi:DNA-binding protein [Bacillus sp. FJAT-29953]|nr:DNA-binding protein [Bacillus sp. FJAT-29953]
MGKNLDIEKSDLPEKLAKPALRALTGAGIFRLDQLSKLSEAEILKLHGMGPKALGQIREALAVKGISFRS